MEKAFFCWNFRRLYQWLLLRVVVLDQRTIIKTAMTVGFSRAGWVVVWHDDTRSWILTPLGTRLLSWQLLLSVAGDDEKCFSSFKSFSAVDKNIDNLHSYLKPSGLYLVCGSQWLYAFKYNPDICKRFNDDYSDYQLRKLKWKKTNLTTLKLILKNHKTSLPRLTTIHIHGYGYEAMTPNSTHLWR